MEIGGDDGTNIIHDLGGKHTFGRFKTTNIYEPKSQNSRLRKIPQHFFFYILKQADYYQLSEMKDAVIY
jgi:hypothetical protein